MTITKNPASRGSGYEHVQHGHSTLNWDTRLRAMRELSTPPIRPYEAIALDLEIGPEDRLLDVGCAGGAGLLELRLQFPHASLTGIDIDDKLFYLTQTLLGQEELDPINFLVARAEALPFPDSSFNKAVVAYVMHYLKDPQRALAELQRVIEPGGMAAILTMDSDHKPWHREFERMMADRLQLTPPKVPASFFNTDAATQILPAYFQMADPVPIISTMVVKDPCTMDIYLDSLRTMRTARDEPFPSQARWEQGLQGVVVPEIQQQIDTYGQFIDQIRHTYFICTNTKDF
jgi:SAM-dependent methyltransferase